MNYKTGFKYCGFQGHCDTEPSGSRYRRTALHHFTFYCGKKNQKRCGLYAIWGRVFWEAGLMLTESRNQQYLKNSWHGNFMVADRLLNELVFHCWQTRNADGCSWNFRAVFLTLLVSKRNCFKWFMIYWWRFTRRWFSYVVILINNIARRLLF